MSEESGKRNRQPNLRYVDTANGFLPKKQVVSKRPEIAATTEEAQIKYSAKTVTTHQEACITEKPTKKRKKSKKVQFEVHCGDIKDLDMVEFVSFAFTDITNFNPISFNCISASVFKIRC